MLKKNILHIAFLSTGLLLYPLGVIAGTAIEGAFGVKLGQKKAAIAALIISERKLSDANDYKFRPVHPYKPLSKYSVFITPQSEQVYKIRATGKFRNVHACKLELGRLEKILSRKYGQKNFDPSRQFTKSSKITFGRGSRRIYVSCTGLFARQLELDYVDKKLAKALGWGSHEKNVLPVAPDASGL